MDDPWSVTSNVNTTPEVGQIGDVWGKSVKLYTFGLINQSSIETGLKKTRKENGYFISSLLEICT